MAECLQDLIQCSICLERFTEPKVLRCQHTFCLDCLRGIVKDDNTLDCPQCRKRHLIPDGDVTVLQDNLIARNLLDAVKESVPCFDCGRKLNLTKCEHCQEEVCPDCRASHAKLLAQIEINLAGAKDATMNDGQVAGRDSWKRVLGQIADEKLRLAAVFDDAAQKMEKRKEEISTFLDQLTNTIERFLDPSMLETLRQEIQNCKTNDDLDKMKDRLENVTKLHNQMLSDAFQYDLKVTYDLPDVNAFGHVKFGEILIEPKRSDVELPVEEPENTTRDNLIMAVTKMSGKKSDSALVIGLNAIVPVCDVRRQDKIDYKAKNNNGQFVRCNDEIPTFALYCPASQRVYCIFAKSVRIYTFTLYGGTWEVFSDSTCPHIALSDSGKLLIADGKTVKIVDLNTIQVGFCYISLLDGLRRIELVGIAEYATQVGCFGKEFVVLDAGGKCLKTFDEDGKFISEFKSDQLEIDDYSRMCVDQEGRIYVTGVRVTKTYSEDRVNLTLTYMLVIAVLSWQGKLVEKIEIDKSCTQSYRGYKQNKRSYSYTYDSPSDGDIRRVNSIVGII